MGVINLDRVKRSYRTVKENWWTIANKECNHGATLDRIEEIGSKEGWRSIFCKGTQVPRAGRDSNQRVCKSPHVKGYFPYKGKGGSISEG